MVQFFVLSKVAWIIYSNRERKSSRINVYFEEGYQLTRNVLILIFI